MLQLWDLSESIVGYCLIVVTYQSANLCCCRFGVGGPWWGRNRELPRSGLGEHKVWTRLTLIQGCQVMAQRGNLSTKSFGFELYKPVAYTCTQKARNITGYTWIKIKVPTVKLKNVTLCIKQIKFKFSHNAWV